MYFTSHLIISRIFTLYNYFIVLFKIAFILIQPPAARTTTNVCVTVCIIIIKTHLKHALSQPGGESQVH